MKGKRWGRRFLVVLLLLMTVCVGLLLTYAYWLPWALRPIAQRYGVTFGSYERLKDGRFALTDVVRTNPAFSLRISRVEGYLPHVWRSRLGQTNSTGSFVEVNGWRVVVHESEKEKKKDGNSLPKDLDVYKEWERVERYIAQGRQLVPRATFLNGAVEYRKKEYTVSVLTWDNGILDGSGVWPETAVPFEVKGKLTGEAPYQISYAMTPLDLRARLRVAETNGLLNAQLAAFYKENRADLSANFAPAVQWPVTATLKAPDFKLPGEMVKLEKYAEVTGALTGEWKTNAYTVELKAHAEPLVTATNMPPADVEIAAQGDTNSVWVERATSTIPGLELVITEPLELSYHGKMLSEESRVRVNADLEKLPWMRLKGRLQGTILLEKGEDLPKATIEAKGTNVSAFNLEASGMQVTGKFDWPNVDGVNAEVHFEDGSAFTVSGGGNLQAHSLTNVVINGEGSILTNFLKGRIGFGGMRIAARADGPLTNLHHAGQFELRGFQVAQIQPINVDAVWKARQITFEDLAIQARAGPASVFVSGSGYAGGGRTNFVVRELRFAKADQPYLNLTKAARLTVTTNLEIEIEPLVLTGTNDGFRELQISAGLRLPHVVAIELRATNVSPALFQPFFVQSLSGLDLKQLNLTAGWSNGPMSGLVSGQFSVQEERLEELTASLDAELGTNGLMLRHLSVLNPESEIVKANGFLPITVHPGELEKVRVDQDSKMEFVAATQPNRAFWQTVSRLSKLNLSNAAVRLAVRGTLRDPTGNFYIKADALEYVHTNRSLPAIQGLEGTLTLNEHMLRVPKVVFRLSGQPIAISGGLLLGEDFWTQRREKIVQYAMEHGEVRVVAPELNLAPYVEHLPKYLRAQGTLSLDMAMREGMNFGGHARMRNVESRPLPRVGVIQDIQADLAFRGKEVHFENVSGVFGGERLALRGSVDLSAESVAEGYPRLDLSVSGANVPLARNPDVILRSDLQLRVTNGTNRIPVVSGTATLRDSFLLRDISTLVPGRIARPERRPPYFSLPQDPIDDWLLDVRVRGDNFMRVRSPFIQGIASANFHVTGTMVEPMALGEATISSGAIIFPFATLEVRQLLVSLTSESPYLPHIYLVASGRAYGFEVRMEVEGPADQPVIEFSSVPSLTSEQILLMLTTGQIPREDFGFSQGGRAGTIALFLGKSLWSKLNPGKPVEERLTIRSGEDVTEQGKQTYEVEYKLNNRWSLVGEYDRFGDLNGNIKWRVFSK